MFPRTADPYTAMTLAAMIRDDKIAAAVQHSHRRRAAEARRDARIRADRLAAEVASGLVTDTQPVTTAGRRDRGGWRSWLPRSGSRRPAW
jgi:hypothetical protein